MEYFKHEEIEAQVKGHVGANEKFLVGMFVKLNLKIWMFIQLSHKKPPLGYPQMIMHHYNHQKSQDKQVWVCQWELGKSNNELKYLGGGQVVCCV